MGDERARARGPGGLSVVDPEVRRSEGGIPVRPQVPARGREAMTLKQLGLVALPKHVGQGSFGHAAVDRGRALLYVAHTANDAVDVIDTRSGSHLRSISGLKGVAGALVDEPTGL